MAAARNSASISPLHCSGRVAARRLHLLHTPWLPPHHRRELQSPPTTLPGAAPCTAVRGAPQRGRLLRARFCRASTPRYSWPCRAAVAQLSRSRQPSCSRVVFFLSIGVAFPSSSKPPAASSASATSSFFHGGSSSNSVVASTAVHRPSRCRRPLHCRPSPVIFASPGPSKWVHHPPLYRTVASPLLLAACGAFWPGSCRRRSS
jgi:hypothetical protein